MSDVKYVTRNQFDLSTKIRDLRTEAQDELRRCDGTLAQKLAIKRAIKTLDEAYRQILEA